MILGPVFPSLPARMLCLWSYYAKNRMANYSLAAINCQVLLSRASSTKIFLWEIKSDISCLLFMPVTPPISQSLIFFLLPSCWQTTNHPPLLISIYSLISKSLFTLCGSQIHLPKLCPLGWLPLCLFPGPPMSRAAAQQQTIFSLRPSMNQVQTFPSLVSWT